MTAQQTNRKRFYQSASFGSEDGGGFAILLDGRAVKTPAGKKLILPTKALAKAIAQEWAAQGETIAPASLPLTRLANSAIDGVAGREKEVADDVLKYASTDLVCYRAEYPQGLVEMQARLWDPILNWVTKKYDAPFLTGSGIAHVTQPAASLDALRRVLEAFCAFQLAAVHVMTSLTGSALIPVAFAGRGIGLDGAWEAAQADEDWQISQWGEDFDATQRQKDRFASFESAARFFALSSADEDA